LPELAFAQTHSIAIETVNEHIKITFDAHGTVLTKGLTATQRFICSAVFVYQLVILFSFFHSLDLRIGLKALIKVI
jgi:hypothetical protein